MKEIPLTQGKVAIVDDEDFRKLSVHKWFAVPDASGGCLAARSVGPAGKQKKVYMHNEILCAPEDKETAHWDNDGLHNVRSNLFVGTRGEIVAHRRLFKPARSGFRGVRWDSHVWGPDKWRAEIRVDGRTMHLGCFASDIAAALAYDAAATKYFGRFARLNFPKRILEPACENSFTPSLPVASSEAGLFSRFFSRLKSLLKTLLPWKH